MSEIEQNKQRNKKNAVQPDFIHVGVMRGGSTWLEAALREHPDVEMYKTRLFVATMKKLSQNTWPIDFDNKT